MTQLLTPAEVADRLRTDQPTVLKMVRSGRLRGVKLPGGDVRIIAASLDDLLSGAAAAKSSPYLNAREAAAFLKISLRTLYNNRKRIPSLPGFKTLAFDPEVLREIRHSLAPNQPVARSITSPTPDAPDAT